MMYREDAAVILHRIIEQKKVAFTENGEYFVFADEKAISDYAYNAVGYITGGFK